MNTTAIKVAACAAAGAVGAFCRPVLPVAAVCTAMTLIDLASAIALGRRLRRKGIADGRLSSRRFGHTVATIVKIYVALLVAAGVKATITVDTAFDPVRFVGFAVCLWQLLSILENESTCSDARWAAKARRFLIDKTRRHTGIEL
ncbi:MAG: hypothetical protein J6C67_02400 [Muribaculaceae bacterium]|nr:hypothetical protein [Muribaculaceae bacterium]